MVGLSGPRALLMMAAHPVAFEGFFMATGSLDDPYKRLRRTAEVMDAVAWGSRGGPSQDRARPRHARQGPRRPAGDARRPVPGRDSRGRPTTRGCCCGSSRASSTPPS